MKLAYNLQNFVLLIYWRALYIFMLCLFLLKLLHEIKFYSRIPTSKPLLTDRQKENRLNWLLKERISLFENGSLLFGVMKVALQYSRMMVRVVFGELPEQDLI